LGEDAADDILVDLDSEGVSDLLGDSPAAETRIAPLHVDDGRDELGGWSFRAGLTAVRRSALMPRATRKPALKSP
jgi:hypothetical protein